MSNSSKKGLLLGAFFVFLAVFLFAFKHTLKQPESIHSISPVSMQKAVQIAGVIPVVVIGAGPAGYSAALYTARQGFKTLVITGNNPGGALMGTSYIENWPGRPKVAGTQVMDDLKVQAESFGATVLYGDAVTAVDFSNWPYVIKTEDDKTIHALSVIIATGSTPKTLGIPGEAEYWGKGVTTCAVCDAPYHRDNDVVVVGGGDSAVEEALQLAHAGIKTITIAVRKDRMRASKAMQDKLADNPNITVLFNTEVTKIIGDGEKVTAVELINNTTGEKITKEVSGYFLAIGHLPNTQLFESQLELNGDGYIKLRGRDYERTQETSMPGVFAAGDVDDDRYRQAGYAAGEGIAAGLDAAHFLQESNFTPAMALQMAHNVFVPEKIARASVALVNSMEELTPQLQDSEGIVLLDFYAPYCPSCMQMLPAFEEIAAKHTDVTCLKIDTSKSNDIAKQYSVGSIPCLLAFKDSQLIGRYNQAMSRAQMEEFIVKLGRQDSISAIA